MKTTVKLSLTESVSVEPHGDAVKLTFKTSLFSFDRILTVDQANAIGFGLDQAYTVIDIRREARENHAPHA